MNTKQTIGLLSVVCLELGCAGQAALLPEPGRWSEAEGPPVGEYLYGANLQGADLQGVDLYRWQLGRADLTNADLRHANLAGAYLFNADLRGADLRGARFSTALKGAELKQTVLVGARFDAATQLPFSEAEALRRGMVKSNEEVASR
jgi:hypothetical protein